MLPHLPVSCFDDENDAFKHGDSQRLVFCRLGIDAIRFDMRHLSEAHVESSHEMVAAMGRHGNLDRCRSCGVGGI